VSPTAVQELGETSRSLRPEAAGSPNINSNFETAMGLLIVTLLLSIFTRSVSGSF
jgi:hypothetical protein